jgi:fatty-acyl-CoA synthase
VRAGDRVAVLARSSIEQVELLLACARLGAILVPLNWRLAPAELGPLLEAAAPTVLFVDEPGVELAGRLPRPLPEDLPRVRLDRSWGEHAAPSSPRPTAEADTPLLILFTSGSTGRPKGAVLTHGSIHFNAVNTVLGWELSATDRTLIAAPLFHTGGWNVLLLPLLFCGGTVHLAPAFDAEQVLESIERDRLTVLFGVPTMFAAMRESARFAGTDLSGLRWVISGGAPCPLPLIEAWWQRGVAFKQGYGLTEVGPNCFAMADDDGQRRAGGVGFPMPWLQLRIVDEVGEAVVDGQPGELLLRGPTVCAGYWRDPEATRDAIRDGWFATGDLFVRETDGWHRCVGRRKEMFISGGENVFPVEVERVLGGLPGVVEAAVVARPDPKWGEVGHAFLACRASASLDPEAARQLCRQHLAGYKVPRQVTVLPELPKGPTGKIDRLALRRLALEQR